jgi:hypothetical protein
VIKAKEGDVAFAEVLVLIGVDRGGVDGARNLLSLSEHYALGLGRSDNIARRQAEKSPHLKNNAAGYG